MLRHHKTIRHMPVPTPTAEDNSPELGDFAVITCHFNWCDFDRPKQNLHRFLRNMRAMGVPVFGIEATLPGQPAQTSKIKGWQQIEADPSNQMLFQKERMLNMAEKLVPEQFTKLGWLDADLGFTNHDWAKETAILLDHFPFVQPFETAKWTNIDGRDLFNKPSTLRMKGGLPSQSHPGFAMAARRSLWERNGGLYENLIVGNGDMGIAAAILGQAVPLTQKYSPELHAHYKPWWEGVSQMCDGRYAFTRGTIWHEWHGSMMDRRYLERNLILQRMDPVKHLTLGPNGLLSWTPEAPLDVVQYVRDYFVNRAEDGGSSPPGACLTGGTGMAAGMPLIDYDKETGTHKITLSKKDGNPAT